MDGATVARALFLPLARRPLRRGRPAWPSTPLLPARARGQQALRQALSDLLGAGAPATGGVEALADALASAFGPCGWSLRTPSAKGEILGRL